MDAKELGALLWANPEPGFYEVETHKILSKAFRGLGFSLEEFQDFPGFIATQDGEVQNKKIFLISDMDALPNPEDSEGRYIHSCGHHQQMVALFETARMLQEQDPETLKSIAFLAVPGEEYIDFPMRKKLMDQGKISSFSGKLELLGRNVFDTPDYIIATHSAGGIEQIFVNSVLKMSGFKVMDFNFSGRSAHAGAQPHRGINAQNAASLFLQAAAFLRESFPEDDHIRIHPILKLAQDQSVNLIPASATVGTYVRGVDQNAVNETVDKLRAAAEGCAKAIGAEVEVTVVQGYAPFKADLELHSLAEKTADELGTPFTEEDFSAASSDVGDLSLFKPTIMLGLPGNNGKFHNPEFRITDEEAAYEFPGRFLAKYLKNLVTSKNL